MAGSYRHCVADDGSFTFDLIENMGDAWEACEEMYGTINELAALLRLVVRSSPHTNPIRAKISTALERRGLE